VQWLPYRSQLDVQQLGAKPVDGGREANGALLYIARVRYNNGVHTAKIGEHLPGAHLAFSGSEIIINVRTKSSTTRSVFSPARRVLTDTLAALRQDYEVLCLN